MEKINITNTWRNKDCSLKSGGKITRKKPENMGGNIITSLSINMKNLIKKEFKIMKNVKRLFLMVMVVLSFGLVSCCTMNVESGAGAEPQYIDFSIQNVGNNDAHFMFFNRVTKNIDQIVDISKNKVAYFYDFQRDMDTYDYVLVTYKDDTKPWAWENMASAMTINTFLSGTWPKDEVKNIKVTAPKMWNGSYSFYCEFISKD